MNLSLTLNLMNLFNELKLMQTELIYNNTNVLNPKLTLPVIISSPADKGSADCSVPASLHHNNNQRYWSIPSVNESCTYINYLH